MSKARLEAFSDGVFAIAITLLVFTIAQPGSYQHLGPQLVHRLPALASYVVSFMVIGIMWLNHHSIFGHIGRVDRPLLYLNMLLLMTVAFVPYPAEVLGQALAHGHGTRAAAMLYGVTLTAHAWAWSGLWLYASRKRRLLAVSFPEPERRAATVAFIAGAVIYPASVLIAFASAWAFLAIQVALACYYAFDPLSRRAARRRAALPAAGDGVPPVLDGERHAASPGSGPPAGGAG